jgi:hypothetical protein
MHIPKKYFHDRAVLLLLSVNSFLAFATTALLLLRIGTPSNVYLVQYRSNLGIKAPQAGSAKEIVAFIVFALLVLLFHTILSIKIYHVRRHFAIVVLAMASILLGLTMIVSNALLSLPAILPILLSIIFIMGTLLLTFVERQR